MHCSGRIRVACWCSQAAWPERSRPLASLPHLSRKPRVPHLRAVPALASGQMTKAVQVSPGGSCRAVRTRQGPSRAQASGYILSSWPRRAEGSRGEAEMSFWFFCNCFDFGFLLFFKKKTLGPIPGGEGADRSEGYFGAAASPKGRV